MKQEEEDKREPNIPEWWYIYIADCVFLAIGGFAVGLIVGSVFLK